MHTPDIRKIHFGYASAEKEGNKSPNLLIHGYYDLHEICEDALDGDHFLILGYKGSGKSAVGERLKLLHADDSQKFIQVLNLEEFPYTSFSQIVKGNEAPQTKYPTAWSWILLIYLLSSLSRDAGLISNHTRELDETLSSLRDMGLLPLKGLHRLVRTTSERTFKWTIPKFFEGTWKSGDTASDIPQYVENLKRLLLDLRTDSRHLIVVDGLDEIVTSKAAQWDSLGSLVFEVNRLNQQFDQHGLNAKIVLLCRTDIFELLESPNKNKIRQDSSIELNWYPDPTSAEQSVLIKVANLRAGLALGRPINIFTELLPPKIFHRATKKVLLDTTRHTPRDFLQLLKYIQSLCTGPRASRTNVRSGIKKYSSDYFLPEILDELDGYIDSQKAKEFFRLIAMFKSREFTAKDTYALAEREASTLVKDEIQVILKALFECSAIANIERRPRSAPHMSFRFRNRHASFDINGQLYLHRGLWYALNLPVDTSWESEEEEDEEEEKVGSSGTSSTTRKPRASALTRHNRT